MPEEKLDNIMMVIDLLEKNKAMLAGLISHSMLINESLKAVIGDCKAVNQNMREAALGLKALAAEATKEEFASPAELAKSRVTKALEGQANLDLGSENEQGDHGVIKDFLNKSSVTDLPAGQNGSA